MTTLLVLGIILLVIGCLSFFLSDKGCLFDLTVIVIAIWIINIAIDMYSK